MITQVLEDGLTRIVRMSRGRKSDGAAVILLLSHTS